MLGGCLFFLVATGSAAVRVALRGEFWVCGDGRDNRPSRWPVLSGIAVVNDTFIVPAVDRPRYDWVSSFRGGVSPVS